MKFLDANSITLVVALVALVSPILVAFLNNLHLKQMKKIDFYEQMKKEEFNRSVNILENFIDSTSSFLQLLSLPLPHDGIIKFDIIGTLDLYKDQLDINLYMSKFADYKRNLALLLTITRETTSSKLIEFDEKLSQGQNIGRDFTPEFLKIVQILKQEINENRPDKIKKID